MRRYFYTAPSQLHHHPERNVAAAAKFFAISNVINASSIATRFARRRFETARNWGRVARRVLEEGRMEFLRERGWNCELRRYVDEAVTGDNLVIVGRRKSKIE